MTQGAVRDSAAQELGMDVTFPENRESWPKFTTRHTLDASGDFYDLALEEVVEYAEGKTWIWPGRSLVFLCDLHADTDAFLRSLLAARCIERTGPEDCAFALTPFGREAVIVIGGDCLDKGPSNLRLLRALRALVDLGAQVDILAGNHDIRALVGLEYMGRKDTRLAHLFVRMGKKSIPLFKEIHDTYLAGGNGSSRHADAEIRSHLFPEAAWYDDFPGAVEGLVPDKRVRKEVVRIREKIQEFEEARSEQGMTLGMIHAAALKARELFTRPNGEFAWYFARMNLARREGSLVFIHAGVDDEVAVQLAGGGVSLLNERFRRLMVEDLFTLYHGALGNAFRTKYRDMDWPLTSSGVRSLRRAGVLAIVHGHRNIPRGQRLVLRNGILNFECDATVDRNTRRLLGLPGVGGAATIVSPEGTIAGISTDYPYVKWFDIRALAGSPMTGPARSRKNGSKRGGWVMEKNAGQLDTIDHEVAEAGEDSSKTELEFEKTLPLAEAVAYVEAIIGGLKTGSLNLRLGDEDITLTPTSHVDIEVTAVRKKKKEGISLEIAWRAGKSDLSISSK